MTVPVKVWYGKLPGMISPIYQRLLTQVYILRKSQEITMKHRQVTMHQMLCISQDYQCAHKPRFLMLGNICLMYTYCM